MRIHHGGTETRRKAGRGVRRRLAQMSADPNELTGMNFLVSVDLRLSAATSFRFSPRLRVSVVKLIQNATP
jgi:hypothetical protein